jgi:hypothetical protein
MIPFCASVYLSSSSQLLARAFRVGKVKFDIERRWYSRKFYFGEYLSLRWVSPFSAMQI